MRFRLKFDTWSFLVVFLVYISIIFKSLPEDEERLQSTKRIDRSFLLVERYREIYPELNLEFLFTLDHVLNLMRNNNMKL